MKDKITITIDRELLKEIENNKPGLYSKSSYIEYLLMKAMNKPLNFEIIKKK